MADSFDVVSKMYQVDPVFEGLCKTLFGDGVDPADVWEYAYTVDGVDRLVSKMSPDSSAVMARGGRLVRRLGDKAVQHKKGVAATGVVTAAYGAGRASGRRKEEVLYSTYYPDEPLVAKADEYDVTWEGEFSKMDEDKRQVFGWASVVEVNGEPVVDRQGDMISPEEMEKSAYEYVLKSRKGGDMHRRNGEDPHHVSDLIESFVLTPEKISKMGLPSSTPVGWWVGFKVNDDSTWDLVKKGARTGFSIHGRGKRVPV